MRRVYLSLALAIAVAFPVTALSMTGESCISERLGASFVQLERWIREVEKPIFLSFSEEKETMARLAVIARKSALSHSLGRCSHWVIQDLIRAKVIPSSDHPWGDNANGWRVGPYLVGKGKLVSIPIDPQTHLPVGCRSLYDVPPGTILTYQTIPGRAAPGECKTCGHIEIRTDQGFASDYRSEIPITGSAGSYEGPPPRSTHILVGVYVPAL